MSTAEKTERKYWKEMAGTTGLEPATSDVTGRRSNQLNYVPAATRTANALCAYDRQPQNNTGPAEPRPQAAVLKTSL
jgi:hypothetical protein